MIKHFCDMCNKEIGDSSKSVSVNITVGSQVKQTDTYYDLCPDCSFLLRQFVEDKDTKYTYINRKFKDIV